MGDPATTWVRATWETIYSEEAWHRAERLKSDVPITSPQGDTGDLLLLGPCLPHPEEPRIASVFVHRDKDKERLSWTLIIQPAPSGEPAARTRELDQALGGRRGLSSLIEASLPPDALPVAVFEINCRMDGSRYTCKSLPRTLSAGGPDDPALVLGHRVSLEQVGYRFENGVNGIGEVAIVYLHREDAFSVRISASGLLRLDAPRWAPFADEVEDIVVRTLFSRRREPG